VLRIFCPSCKYVFLRLEVLGEDDVVTCPRCKVTFRPDEEEILDPEND
jgi:uncharacterized protein YbaR (Trm112 family)